LACHPVPADQFTIEEEQRGKKLREHTMQVPKRGGHPKVSGWASATLGVLLLAASMSLAGTSSAVVIACKARFVPNPTGPKAGKHTDCRGLTIGDWDNFSGLNLKWADFTGANFINGANLEGAKLNNANFANAKFTGANLTDAKLDDANMTGVYFEKTKLDHAVMVRTILNGAHVMEGTTLQDADITGTQLMPMTPKNPGGIWVGNVTQDRLKRATIQIDGTRFDVCIEFGHPMKRDWGPGTHTLKCRIQDNSRHIEALTLWRANGWVTLKVN
jgi:hypothetical protein